MGLLQIGGRFFTIWATREAQCILTMVIVLYVTYWCLFLIQLEVCTFWPPSSNSLFPLCWAQTSFFMSLVFGLFFCLARYFQVPCVSEIMHYFSFSIWLISLCILPSGPFMLFQMPGSPSFSWLSSSPFHLCPRSPRRLGPGPSITKIFTCLPEPAVAFPPVWGGVDVLGLGVIRDLDCGRSGAEEGLAELWKHTWTWAGRSVGILRPS